MLLQPRFVEERRDKAFFHLLLFSIELVCSSYNDMWPLNVAATGIATAAAAKATAAATAAAAATTPFF